MKNKEHRYIVFPALKWEKVMKRLLTTALLLGVIFGIHIPAAHAALTLEDALLILGEQILQPSSGTNAVNVHMTAAPLSSGVVTPVSDITPSPGPYIAQVSPDGVLDLTCHNRIPSPPPLDLNSRRDQRQRR